MVFACGRTGTACGWCVVSCFFVILILYNNLFIYKKNPNRHLMYFLVLMICVFLIIYTLLCLKPNISKKIKSIITVNNDHLCKFFYVYYVYCNVKVSVCSYHFNYTKPFEILSCVGNRYKILIFMSSVKGRCIFKLAYLFLMSVSSLMVSVPCIGMSVKNDGCRSVNLSLLILPKVTSICVMSNV